MAVDTTVLFKRYDCDGANKSFPITFDYLETAGFVQVLLYDSSAGSYTTLALTTDYTVSSDTVTTVATHGSTYDILLRLDFTDLITQGTDWVENDKFTSGSWENAVDKLTLVCQWLAEQVNRSIKGPPVDVAGRTWEIDGALDSVNGVLVFDGSGNVVVGAATIPSTATVTAFAETFLDDTSLSAMLSTLEIPFSAFAKTLVDDADAATMRTTIGAVGLTGNETIAGEKTFSTSIVATLTGNVTGDHTGARRLVGSLYGTSLTQASVFNALSPAIPVINNSMLVCGGITTAICAYASRISASLIYVYSISGGAQTAVVVTEGASGSFAYMALAW